MKASAMKKFSFRVTDEKGKTWIVTYFGRTRTWCRARLRERFGDEATIKTRT